MATYVVGDIHGCFREWISLKSKIEALDQRAEFILVDRLPLITKRRFDHEKIFA